MPWTFTGFWLVMSVLVVGASPPWGQALVAAGAVGLVLRCRMLGVYDQGTHVTIVSWFTTRTFHYDEIAAVRPVAYDGLATRFSESRLFSVLEIETTRSERWRARSTVARPAWVAALADQLRQRVGLPPHGVPPRHAFEAEGGPPPSA